MSTKPWAGVLLGELMISIKVSHFLCKSLVIVARLNADEPLLSGHRH